MNWGYTNLIKIVECDKKLLNDIEYSKLFLKELVDFIKMTPYGDPIVVRFGRNPKVTGLSGFQLLEESNISFHFVDGGKDGKTYEGYVDIFSCKEFSGHASGLFCAEYFNGKLEYQNYIPR